MVAALADFREERAEIGKIDADTVNVLNNTGLFPQEALGSQR